MPFPPFFFLMQKVIGRLRFLCLPDFFLTRVVAITGSCTYWFIKPRWLIFYVVTNYSEFYLYLKKNIQLVKRARNAETGARERTLLGKKKMSSP